MPVQDNKRTVILTEEANAYLGAVVPGRTGHGQFISKLLVSHKIRKQWAERYRAIEALEEWDATGLRVV